ncbi:MAG: hypothetical protein FJ398_25280 [Verrucomicrobia bacterium]|nr:hypothetical protein [Verrucomicrobiota bacterium]
MKPLVSFAAWLLITCAQASAAAPSTTETPPPVAISYSLPRAGEAALVIDDSHGRRVRNLFAQVPRQAGNNAEPWDLKDDSGVTVPPGDYRWKVVPKGVSPTY